MNTIETIGIMVLPDKSPDTSCLGEYTDDLGPGVIIRGYQEVRK